jgi:hypothetical protein
MNINIPKIYNILLESYIIFVLFAVFFFILIKYILTPFQLDVTSNFAIKQLEFYGLDLIKQTSQFKENIEKTKIELQNTEHKRQLEVDAANKEYENKQIIILISMSIGIAIILSIPILLGFIKLGDINWKYLALVLMVNLMIILIFEFILIYFVIGQFSAIRFYPAFM